MGTGPIPECSIQGRGRVTDPEGVETGYMRLNRNTSEPVISPYVHRTIRVAEGYCRSVLQWSSAKSSSWMP
jgi:hypothetical protein